jgi:2-polyprenyl-6-methoxyphenol hydroxylase-like FAD-dependent oxidoreductase
VADRLSLPGGATLTGIAVVGAGIGGLAAAAFLRRAGLAATVYEQASALGDLGAGLVVAPNAARLLRRLPSEFGLERAGVVLESGWEFRRCTGPTCWRCTTRVSAGRLVNIVAFSPASSGEVESWSAVGQVADLAAEFAGWDPRARQLIAAADHVGRWSVLDRAPLPRWVKGRIALLGDAEAGAGSRSIICPTGRSKWPGTRSSRARTRSATTTGSTPTTPSTPPRPRRRPG